MKRTRVRSLALLNWKGIFYWRFVFDERVTALEGQNGAGKTTVMIAAYIALLPDMGLLRFTNVGEHGATGGDRGIYGRLGDPGRPTYTVLDVQLPDGERLLCGVQLVRRSAPSIEPTPFVISGLPWEVALQDVLLERGEVDAIPELDELKQNAARAGGRLMTFASAKEYFATLFEYGVTPLRLGSDDERTKFNEVLRTSMVGGISRALGSELRNFLLKEESGLADTLKNMRASLEACRKTRGEVQEASRLEAEIHAILEAGQEMFAAAVHAAQTRATEQQALWKNACDEFNTASDAQEMLTRELEEKKVEQESAANAHTNLKVQRQDVDKEITRLKQLCSIDEQIYREAKELAKHTEEAARALAVREDAEGRRDRCRELYTRAQDAQEAAARGLADVHKGYEELVTKAAAYRRACETRTEIQEAFPEEGTIDKGILPALAHRCDEQVAALARSIAQIEGRLRTAAEHSQEFDRVAQALRILWGALESEAEFGNQSLMHEQALHMLRLLREQSELALQIPSLAQELTQTRQRIPEQKKVYAEARSLGQEGVHLARMADVLSALQETERGLDTAEALCRERDEELRHLKQEAQTHRRRAQELEKEQQRYRRVRAAADELQSTWEKSIGSSADLVGLRQFLEERRTTAERQAEEADAELQSLREEIRLTEQCGRLSDDLLRARDMVDGELLASRFEDVALEQAGPLQARLGPLYEAIVVEDADAAAARLSALGRTARPETVWLVDGVEALQELITPSTVTEFESDVLIRGTGIHRLTQVPERPVLGRRARLQRAGELRRREQNQSGRMSELRADCDRLREGLDAVAGWLIDCSALDSGDPSNELDRTRGSARRAEEAQPSARAALEDANREVTVVSKRKQRLLSLCANAHLLELPDQEQASAAITERLRDAQLCQERLARTAQQREIVESQLEVLRDIPISPSALKDMKKEHQQLAEERDKQSLLLSKVRFLLDNSDALDWADAATALEQRRALKPSLEKRLARAKEACAEAREASEEADRSYDEATRAEQGINAELQVVAVQLRTHREERARLQFVEATPEQAAQALSAAQARLSEIAGQLQEAEKRERVLVEEVARLTERRQLKEEEVLRLREAMASAERAWKPDQDRWERLMARAQEAGVLAAALAERFGSKFQGQGAVNLWAAAQEQRGRLCERLRKVRDGDELAKSVEALFSAASDQSSGDAYLASWQSVRAFLLRCIPAQVAEADDPQIGLLKLRDHLRRLEHKLKAQEDRLRGSSQDVALSIEGQVRKARKNVARLNQDLAGVRFGSIAGVKINVVSAEKMEQVLRALKDGAAQTLLFSAELPLEEALEEIFKSYGGGRTGGHKLLDYREYLELVVQIRRQVGTEWEPVNATRMSTGEAIGVGAAVMMVILTAWERDANLLRPKRTAGTLRMLFLDEANRLSQDSLGVLFDLCQSLDLQLLIAAPEVARAEGNTTYHLVRKVEDGRETVRISGRQVIPREAAQAGAA